MTRRPESPAGNSTIGRCAEAHCAWNSVQGRRQTSPDTRAPRPPAGREVSPSLADLPATIERYCGNQKALQRQRHWRSARATPTDAKTYDELKKAVENGFAFSFWCGSGDCEAKSRKKRRPPCAAFPWQERGSGQMCLLRQARHGARDFRSCLLAVSFREHVRRQFLDTRSREC